ncbi:MAG: MerR family transcriptional regulator [Gammaproteobacteria bacterium]|nr:MerR family transcriptional regulator [Gammaproteobacteria bacterium]
MKQESRLFNIAAVERETGIGKDTLRVWERRYGFPTPERNEREDRLYPEAQVDRLRLIKRLLNIGLRPSKVVGLELNELNALLSDAPGSEEEYPAELQEFIRLTKAHQAAELRLAFNRAMLKQGLNAFLSKTVSPLNRLVGEAWLRGDIRVFEEHLYSEQLTNVLRTAMTSIRDAKGSPRVLLTTLPGEEHSLGLLMAEATLSLSGAHCIMLGVQTPINELVMAVKAHQVDVLALSFSSSMPAALVKSGIEQVRNLLPTNVEIWIGGLGAQKQRSIEDSELVMESLADLTDAVEVWRAAAGQIDSKLTH